MIDPATKHANENLTRLEKMRMVCEMSLFFSYCFFFFSLLVVLGHHKAVPRPCLAVAGGGCSQVVVGGLPSAAASLAQAINSWT